MRCVPRDAMTATESGARDGTALRWSRGTLLRSHCMGRRADLRCTEYASPEHAARDSTRAVVAQSPGLAQLLGRGEHG